MALNAETRRQMLNKNLPKLICNMTMMLCFHLPLLSSVPRKSNKRTQIFIIFLDCNYVGTRMRTNPKNVLIFAALVIMATYNYRTVLSHLVVSLNFVSIVLIVLNSFLNTERRRRKRNSVELSCFCWFFLLGSHCQTKKFMTNVPTIVFTLFLLTDCSLTNSDSCFYYYFFSRLMDRRFEPR